MDFFLIVSFQKKTFKQETLNFRSILQQKALNKIDSNTSISDIETYLFSKEWLNPQEKVLEVKKPGEGNMNVVLRIKTNQRSFILKQSRPFVQKYQEIKAPLNRIIVEKSFYELLCDTAVNKHIPKILGFDPAEYLLLLEDLGHCEDMVTLYAKRDIETKQLNRLISILSLIHRKKIDGDFPQNLEMRILNHQHIFVLPFLEDNGFQLDTIQPGLQELALPFKHNKAIKAVVEKVGDQYLLLGNTLLHGDYYPGSWMTEADHLYVIDPEFAFVGFPEFDLGVMAAHIIIATGSKSYLKKIYSQYPEETNLPLVSQVAGIEMLRRLIGLAQLPLKRSLKEKKKLLNIAHKLILES